MTPLDNLFVDLLLWILSWLMISVSSMLWFGCPSTVFFSSDRAFLMTIHNKTTVNKILNRNKKTYTVDCHYFQYYIFSKYFWYVKVSWKSKPLYLHDYVFQLQICNLQYLHMQIYIYIYFLTWTYKRAKTFIFE